MKILGEETFGIAGVNAKLVPEQLVLPSELKILVLLLLLSLKQESD
jgi:hypothetical protein